MEHALIVSSLLRLQDLFGLLSNERKEDGRRKNRVTEDSKGLCVPTGGVLGVRL